MEAGGALIIDRDPQASLWKDTGNQLHGEKSKSDKRLVEEGRAT